MHVPVKFEPSPQITDFIDNEELDDLEIFILAVQSLINIQKKTGKKGIKIKGIKLTYDRLQGMLNAFKMYFSQKGCFTNGICASCKHFQNSKSTTGAIGTCSGSGEKYWLDTCGGHYPRKGEETW